MWDTDWMGAAEEESVGRIPMGDEGRTVKATLRITAQEKRMLTDEFGSDGRGLRALVDAWWRGKPLREAGTDRVGHVDERLRPPLVVPGAAHPMLDDDVPMAWVADVGASVVGMSEQEMHQAIALDQVAQSMPLPGTIAAGLDSPDVGMVFDPTAIQDPAPEPHRHVRGVLLETTWDHGTKVRTFACKVPGCPVVLS
jgi:hypothetical protein